MDTTEKIMILQYGYLREAREMLEKEANELFYKLCDDFGANKSRHIDVEICKEFQGYIGRNVGYSFIEGIISDNILIFPLPVLRLAPEYSLSTTLPHEICHAFHIEFFPETRTGEYHGELWVDLMKHLGKVPNVRCTEFSSNMIARFQIYQE